MLSSDFHLLVEYNQPAADQHPCRRGQCGQQDPEIRGRALVIQGLVQLVHVPILRLQVQSKQDM